MIENRVAESELVTIDLSTLLPTEQPAHFDIKEFLFRGLILKEKEFRSSLKEHNWNIYNGKIVLLYCSADAIVPVWAYMLVVVYLKDRASGIFFNNEDQWRETMLLEKIENITQSIYLDKKVVIKGCGEEKIPDSAFVAITNKLLPVTKSIMYGEPCSTVPIYKKK